jgi:SAM-dependent methyltransferase
MPSSLTHQPGTVLTHPLGTVQIDDLGDCKNRITVTLVPGVYSPATTWVTRYPPVLIEHLMNVKGPAHFCDEIMREEDPHYVEHHLRWDLLSYIRASDLAGRRILDFGSGAGSSSLVLARLFPEAEILGVELLPKQVALARERIAFHGLQDRVKVQQSGDPKGLPPGIGQFACIVLSAVYEHLLGEERQALMPLLWDALEEGGTLFLGQTPYRWFPIELHSTGLPFLNYLPDALAFPYARYASRRIPRADTWPNLLRNGIRGGTTRSILRELAARKGEVEVLQPRYLGAHDEISLWYQRSIGRGTKLLAKRIVNGLFRLVRWTTGLVMVPQLTLALQKKR